MKFTILFASLLATGGAQARCLPNWAQVHTADTFVRTLSCRSTNVPDSVPYIFNLFTNPSTGRVGVEWRGTGFSMDTKYSTPKKQIYDGRGQFSDASPYTLTINLNTQANGLRVGTAEYVSVSKAQKAIFHLQFKCRQVAPKC